MKINEVREWLHKNCKNMSIMWKMNHSGRIDPKHRSCYLIEGNEQTNLDDSDFFPNLKIVHEIELPNNKKVKGE